jgi:hypothetical protein
MLITQPAHLEENLKGWRRYEKQKLYQDTAQNGDQSEAFDGRRAYGD